MDFGDYLMITDQTKPWIHHLLCTRFDLARTYVLKRQFSAGFRSGNGYLQNSWLNKCIQVFFGFHESTSELEESCFAAISACSFSANAWAFLATSIALAKSCCNSYSQKWIPRSLVGSPWCVSTILAIELVSIPGRIEKYGFFRLHKQSFVWLSHNLLKLLYCALLVLQNTYCCLNRILQIASYSMVY